ncbi:hypothetical protein LshimejAT787_0202000 [Lyophyllum shimeji]|uniref:Uncharacterized protein n=1 Tax=Lyophyllum shimeji TaxID=47721 RepID=A0A9P3PES8_LYOSH|nr:hypothetical protein LshimejAT787_0202000 [Lyophyllum shimeji]
MQAKFLLAVLASSLTSLASGAAVEARSTLDIFDPRIILPNARSVWVAGQVETVTWDTSNAPANISNLAAIVLNSASGPLSANLATGFDLRSGVVDVTVPKDVPSGLNSITQVRNSGLLTLILPSQGQNHCRGECSTAHALGSSALHWDCLRADMCILRHPLSDLSLQFCAYPLITVLCNMPS